MTRHMDGQGLTVVHEAVDTLMQRSDEDPTLQRLGSAYLKFARTQDAVMPAEALARHIERMAAFEAGDISNATI